MCAQFRPRENPALYEINTAAWLWELSQTYGAAISLANIPEAEWDSLKAYGMDYIWLMGIWQRSPRSRLISLLSDEFKKAFAEVEPAFTEDDILGSPYAIQAYQPDITLGNWEDLRTVRDQLHRHGMGLILDLVPNHTAMDHEWVNEHPEYYILGTFKDFLSQPGVYFEGITRSRSYYIAHGRDPNFPPWTDTAQLNYANPATRAAIIRTVGQIAPYCDGLRCDMAMLIMNNIIQRVWGGHENVHLPATEFWRELTAAVPDMVYIAEAYWDTEWELQQMGFDYVYDKRLYDRLRYNPPGDIVLHLKAALDFQSKLVRFTENHDEPRSPQVFGQPRAQAAAALTSLLPGMKMYFHRQWEGRRLKLPVQLRHTQPEIGDAASAAFYQKLLTAANDETSHRGFWKLKTVYPHAEEHSGDLIAYTRQLERHIKLVIVNLGPYKTQGRIHFQDDLDESADYRLIDRLNGVDLIRPGVWMAHPGLVFDLAGYQAALYDIQPVISPDSG